MYYLAIEWAPDPVLLKLGSFELRYYSLCFALGLFLGYKVVINFWRKEGGDSDTLDSLAVLIFVATVLGARIGHCLFYEPEYYLQHPLQILLPFRQINGAWEFTGYQGLASHGGILAVLLAIIYWCRKHKKSILHMLDIIVIGGTLTGAFIRLGNFMNSEILGKATGSDRGIIFSLIDDIPRHPAQLYESLSYFFIFLLLFSIWRKRGPTLKPGFIVGIYLILLFGARFVIEFFKENQVAFEDGMQLNMGQWLSVPFVIAGFIMLYIKRGTKGV